MLDLGWRKTSILNKNLSLNDASGMATERGCHGILSFLVARDQTLGLRNVLSTHSTLKPNIEPQAKFPPIPASLALGSFGLAPGLGPKLLPLEKQSRKLLLL